MIKSVPPGKKLTVSGAEGRRAPCPQRRVGQIHNVGWDKLASERRPTMPCDPTCSDRLTCDDDVGWSAKGPFPGKAAPTRSAPAQRRRPSRSRRQPRAHLNVQFWKQNPTITRGLRNDCGRTTGQAMPGASRRNVPPTEGPDRAPNRQPGADCCLNPHRPRGSLGKVVSSTRCPFRKWIVTFGWYRHGS